MEIGFDLISDLYLEPNDSFNWEGKATSLYCIVAGNISSDSRTILGVLSHLSKYYQAVFYVPGPLEFLYKSSIVDYTEMLLTSVNRIPNVSTLFHNVVIINGVAILGATGWTGELSESFSDIQVVEAAHHDLIYLHKSLAKLQKHLDVKSIIIVTSGVPSKTLYFKEEPTIVNHQLPLVSILGNDTENKVTNWLFGNYKKVVDTTIEGIRYTNNPYYGVRPYWAKRINIQT